MIPSSVPRHCWQIMTLVSNFHAGVILLDELFLLVRIGFPQEPSHFVVADADAAEQILHAAGLVGDAKGLQYPVANLVRVAEAARADFIFESIDLVGGKVARIALVVKGAEDIDPLVAKDTEPFAQLAEADPQHMSDFITALALGDGQDGSEALIHTPVKGSLASLLDLPSLLGSQDNRFHGRVLLELDGSFRLPSLLDGNRCI